MIRAKTASTAVTMNEADNPNAAPMNPPTAGPPKVPTRSMPPKEEIERPRSSIGTTSAMKAIREMPHIALPMPARNRNASSSG